MKALQASFASGEITPLLHARVDLARYQTGLAELRNMIVLPQGGVTRRPGIFSFATADNVQDRLIPFEYNATDSCLLDFGDKTLNIWYNLDATPQRRILTTPYTIEDVKDLRYVQSGNVMFLAHRKYKPQILTRHSLTSWTLENFSYHSGPFINGTEYAPNATIRISRSLTDLENRTITGTNIDFSSLLGTLIKLEYVIPTQSKTYKTSDMRPETMTRTTGGLEVKGTLNVSTSGKWLGSILIERSSDGGETWVGVRQYNRTDIDTQGQWDFSISENEAYILYRVTITRSSDSSDDITATIFKSGFLKSEIYKFTSISSSTSATITRQNSLGYSIDDMFYGEVSLWSIGAWGDSQGYPGAIAMYQDRLVFAATDYQPQTIWMSRVGDYANFSISDPLQDDDAVTITLAGSSADGIHSLLTAADLLAFTYSGEWKIKGAGDAGAITPTALTAHQQTSIGSKNIQPLLVNGHIIMIQTLGTKVFSLGYDLNIDGYSGSELSILSEHLLTSGVIGMAYQKIPDSLLWFVLDDGKFVSCTYNPEHEVIGWAEHESYYKAKAILSITGKFQTDIYMITVKNSNPLLVKFRRRSEENYIDLDQEFESVIRTLRLNYSSEEGNMFNAKNLISRAIISTRQSREAWVAPGNRLIDTDNWERRRKISWDYSYYITDSDIQLDNGFSDYACLQVRSSGTSPLTIAAITPQVTAGG